MTAKRCALLLVGLVLLGIGVRAVNIGTYSFWYDEALSLLYTDDLSRLLPGGERGTDSPLYLSCLYLWRLFGTSDGYLRWLSLLFGVATIPVLYLLGKELSGRGVGLIAAALLAISAVHAFYAQELRTYTLTTLLATTSVWLFVRMLIRQTPRSLILFMLFASLTAFTHYYAGLLLVAANAYFFLFLRRHRKLLGKWLLAHGLLALLFIPNLLDMINQIEWASKKFWTWPVGINDPPLMWVHFYFGYYINATVLKVLGFAVGAGLFALGLYRFSVRRPADAATRGRVHAGVLLGLFSLVPIAVVLGVSAFLRAALITRYFLFCSPILFLVLAVSLAAIRPRVVAGALAAFFVGMNAYGLYGLYANLPIEKVQGVLQKGRYKEMADYIRKSRAKGDVIFHSHDATLVPVRYYCRGAEIENILIVTPGREKAAAWFPGLENENPLILKCDPAGEAGTGLVLNEADRLRIKKFKRVWFVEGWWKYRGEPQWVATAKEARDWLKIDYDEDPKTISFDGGIITLYTKKRRN